MPPIRLLAFAAVLSMLPATAFSQPPAAALQQELIAADRNLWQAIAGPHPNAAVVGQGLASDYMDIDGGVAHSREQVLKDLQSLRDFSFQYSNPRAVVLSPTSGYVIAELTFSCVVEGKRTSGRVLTTSIFSKDAAHPEQARWMSHLHTEMDLPAPAKH